MRKHVRIWWRLAAMSLQAQLTYRLGSVGFLFGKLVRLFFFFAYIIAIFTHTKTLAGYSLVETALFFLTFNVVDIIAQVFLRGIYAARRVVTEGDLDYFLIQPCSALFRMACTTVDFIDILTMIPVVIMIAEAVRLLPQGVTGGQLVLYMLLLLNALAVAFSLHVVVAALTVRTQELDNTIWLYRDMMFLGKFPSDIYSPALQVVLSSAIPVALMVSFPARALIGRLSMSAAVYAFVFAAAAVAASLWFWNDALSRYTSVSS